MLTGKYKDLVCYTRCPPKVAGLRIGTKKLASAALDEEMPWRALTSEADTRMERTRAMERKWDIVRASSFLGDKAVAGNDALLYHRALH